MTQKLCYTPPKINKDDDIHDAKHKNQDVKWADVECSPTISAVNLKKQPLNSRLPLYHYFQMDRQLRYKTRMITSISSKDLLDNKKIQEKLKIVKRKIFVILSSFATKKDILSS